ncbi:hypothetical protein FXO38_01764 [Capsicum annuum]|nr:hypothetical protein FXO38_01764 [Capsicum annuum]
MTEVIQDWLGCSYGFGGLLTRFLRTYKVDEEELDYKLEIVTCPVDITIARSIDGAQGPILTMAEHQARANEISSRIFGLQMLHLRIWGIFKTHEELHDVELYYPLCRHARTLLWIEPEFVEPMDNDVPTDEERRYQDSDVELDAEDQFDNGDGDANTDDGYDKKDADNAIKEIVPFD